MYFSHSQMFALFFHLLCIGGNKMEGEQVGSEEYRWSEHMELYGMKHDVINAKAGKEKTGITIQFAVVECGKTICI